MDPTRNRPDASAPPLHVLVVGDDPSLVDECREAFGQMQDRTTVLYHARNGRDAMETARDRQPQLVIADSGSDIDLPVLTRELADLVPRAAVTVAHAPHTMPSTDATVSVIEWMRAGARDFLRRPISPVELSGVLERLFLGREHVVQGPSGVVVSFVSNKGGVGKSTLSVNVACALAEQHPGQVLLIDASLQLGVCALMLGVVPAGTIVDAARERDRLDEALLRGLSTAHESGVRLLGAPADALEAADISDEAFARVVNVARRAFTYVVIDTFPLLDSVVMAALDASDLIVTVLQATAPSVAGMARLLPVLEGLGFPANRQLVVLNRNHRRFLGDLSTRDAMAGLGRQIDVVVPYDKGVLVSMNTGEPYALKAHRWTGFSRALRAIVSRATALQSGHVSRVVDEAVDPLRRRLEPERRGGPDRRRQAIAYPGVDRRSGVDRRLQTPAVAPAGDTGRWP